MGDKNPKKAKKKKKEPLKLTAIPTVLPEPELVKKPKKSL